MAVPRPVLLALLGVALCAAALLATRGARDPGGAVTSVPTQAPARPATKPTAKPAHPVGRAHEARTSKQPAARHKAAAPSKPAPLPGVRDAAGSAAPGKSHARRAPGKPALAPAAETAVRVKAALVRGDAVVFFFTRAGAADDTGARGAIKSVHGMKHVMVVKAGLADLTTFRPVLAGAGVSQIPSVVVVHRGKPARLIEGYVDRGTLRQNISDALR
jgi:hypothetical protein